MIQTIEKEKTYLIPIEDTDSKWVQTKEIPATYSELQIGPTSYAYLRFVLDGKPSPLDIVAGDPGNVEIAGKRIRTQMKHRLGRALAALKTSEPYQTASLEAEQIGQYFSPRIF